jgi:hypothetical protein
MSNDIQMIYYKKKIRTAPCLLEKEIEEEIRRIELLQYKYEAQQKMKNELKLITKNIFANLINKR